MAILVECPGCRYRQRDETERYKKMGKVQLCKKCKTPFSKFSGRVFWVEYYHQGRRRRERIGPNKAFAQTILQKRLVERAEGRLLNKKKEDKIRFDELAKWYLNLPEVKAKRSYERDERSIKKLKTFFGSKLVADISPSLIEAYRQHSLNQENYKGLTNKPATVNREIACLKTIFSKAIKNRKIEYNPTLAISQLRESNERNRVLSPEEWQRYKEQCPSWYLPIATMAYLTGMRKGEIIDLSVPRVDLKTGFIRLRAEDTKTKEGRPSPFILN